MDIRQVGVDLAKNVFQLHGADIRGKAVWKRKLSRERWVESVCKTVPKGCEIGMEACGGAHYWARRALSQSWRTPRVDLYSALQNTRYRIINDQL